MHRDEQGRRQFRDDDSYRGNEGRGRFEDRDDYRSRGYEMSPRDYDRGREDRYEQDRYGRSDDDRYGRNSEAMNRNMMQSAYGDDYRYRQERWSPSENRMGTYGGGYGMDYPRYDSSNYGMGRGYGSGYGSSAYRDSDRFSPYRSYGQGQYGGQGWSGQSQYGQRQFGQDRIGQGQYGQGQYGSYYPYGQSSNQYGQSGQGSYGQSEYGQGGYGSREYGSNVAPGGYMPPSENTNYYGGQGRYEQGRYGSFGSGYGWQGRNMRGPNRGPKGYKRSDERIKEDICDRLSMQDLDSSEIEVSVSNGEVTLSGSVSDRSMKYEAEQICDAVQGVNEISNQLRIRRGAESMSGMGSSYGTSGSNTEPETTSRSTTGRTTSQSRS